MWFFMQHSYDKRVNLYEMPHISPLQLSYGSSMGIIEKERNLTML